MKRLRHQGKHKIELILPNEDYAPLLAEAKELGIGVGAVVRLKLKGLEITRKAA